MNKYKNFAIIGLLAVVVILVIAFMPKQDTQPANNNTGTNNDGTNNTNQNPSTAVNVTDFDSCAKAGYSLLETNPIQCKTPEGKVYTNDATEGADVIIETPTQAQLVTSPLTVSGKARGSWFFEANLPVTLKDQNGKILVQKGAQAQGDWMTTDYVNFTVVLEFTTPATEFGTLVIEKDNASGLPENDKAFPVVVRFK